MMDTLRLITGKFEITSGNVFRSGRIHLPMVHLLRMTIPTSSGKTLESLTYRFNVDSQVS
jgi:hypothetical protein